MNNSSNLLGTLWAFCVLAIIIALTACNPVLYVESPAPPGRTARMDPVTGFWGLKYYTLEISTGVALALTCEDAGPCNHVKITSDDPSVIEVRNASLSVLKSMMYGAHTQQQTAAAVVLVGKAAGSTRVHVHADEGYRMIEVKVIPPPSSGAQHASIARSGSAGPRSVAQQRRSIDRPVELPEPVVVVNDTARHDAIPR